MNPTLEDYLGSYLRQRRLMGHHLVGQEAVLGDFLKFLDTRQFPGITIEAALDWATRRPESLPVNQASRLSKVRMFAAYVHARDPSAACLIPPKLIAARVVRTQPFIYSPEQTRALMAAARQLKPAIRGLNTTTIIGLMACTGLRLSECLKLDLQDVDFHESILTVNGKRGHQRLVPLHPSTARALVEYMRLSRQMVTGIHTDAFFINSYRNRPSPGTVEHAFRQLRTILAYGPPPGGRPPRLHDFRHTYTTTSLLQAYKDGKDIDAHIAALATYLGHVSPESTYWYLSAVPELMNLVAGRISPIDLTEAHHD